MLVRASSSSRASSPPPPCPASAACGETADYEPTPMAPKAPMAPPPGPGSATFIFGFRDGGVRVSGLTSPPQWLQTHQWLRPWALVAPPSGGSTYSRAPPTPPRDMVTSPPPLAPLSCERHLRGGGYYRANMAHIRQSRPDFGRVFQVKVLQTFNVVLSSLSSDSRGAHARPPPPPRDNRLRAFRPQWLQ